MNPFIYFSFLYLNSMRLGSILLYLKCLLLSHNIYAFRISLIFQSRAAADSSVAAELIIPLHPILLDIRYYPLSSNWEITAPLSRTPKSDSLT